MTLNTAVTFPLPAELLFNRGMSEDSKSVRRKRNSENESDTSYSTGIQKERILNDLFSAIRDALEGNWDGYDASPIDYLSIDYATSFICQLSSEIPSPEIYIDNDGEVAIEWDYGARNIISIRVGRDGTLHYAGLVGFATYHGMEQYHENIPESILSGILRVVRAA